eukprot:m.88461 g.88461  ORF g.88461 m.88461 type:complete len:84 (+) comp15186_c0_seq2:197-448(+)
MGAKKIISVEQKEANEDKPHFMVQINLHASLTSEAFCTTSRESTTRQSIWKTSEVITVALFGTRDVLKGAGITKDMRLGCDAL